MHIKLHSDGYEVTVNTMGAELKSFRDPSGKEYVWNSDPAYWMRSSPLLFPTIGNLRNGQTTMKGEVYPLVKHGFCKDSEFEVTNQSADSVTFLLRANDETLKSYPYQFELFLSYHLNGNELSMDYRVVNKDPDEMYYHIGAHPGFMLPVSEEETIADCALVFEKEENFVSYAYDLENMEFNEEHTVTQHAEKNVLPLTVPMFDEDAVFFEHTNSHRVSFLNVHTKKGVTMDYPDFESIAFWTPASCKAPFLCLEPWNGSAVFHQDDDIFSHKRGILALKSGEEKTYHLKITLNDKPPSRCPSSDILTIINLISS